MIHDNGDWPGVALVARLPRPARSAPRSRPRQGNGKATFERVGRLVVLKQYLQARLNEVARVLRTPPPALRLDHHGNASIGPLAVPLDLRRVEALRQAPPMPAVCALTLLRASLACLLEPLLPSELLGRLRPSVDPLADPLAPRPASTSDFLAGYVLAAFRASGETCRAFLCEVAPLPDDQSPAYRERLLAFEQGQLAYGA